MATTKTKLEATVATVKAAAGHTWFDCSDEGDHIELSSRSHGDVGSERAGKADIDEGKRLLKLVTKVFKPLAWSVTYDVVDEWVSVSVRVAPLTKKEKDRLKLEKKMRELRAIIKDACDAANIAHEKPNARKSFSGLVYEGCGHFTPSIKVVFGERKLYRSHLGAEFVFATESEADAALAPIVARLPDMNWQRNVIGPSPNVTYNFSPPNNVIEYAGAVEYEVRINAR